MEINAENAYATINITLTGRCALFSSDEAAALWRVAARPGDHVEIGCLWGATAILAALAKEAECFPGHVYTIDFMRGGFWEHGDPLVECRVPTPGIILDNLAALGVAHRVSVLKCASDPWPLPAAIRPASVLIDGDHSYQGCLADWRNVRRLKAGIVAFHDYDEIHPGVRRVVDECVDTDPDWVFAGQTGALRVYEYAR